MNKAERKHRAQHFHEQLQALKIERDRNTRATFEFYQTKIRDMKEEYKVSINAS